MAEGSATTNAKRKEIAMSKKANHPFKTVSVALFIVALVSTNSAIWGQTYLPNPRTDLTGTGVYGLVDIKGTSNNLILSACGAEVQHFRQNCRRFATFHAQIP